MATVREKYNSLQEGKINQKQFLEFVRKDPNLKGVVSPVQSFKDIVRVLSNRRIIVEDLSNTLDKACRSATAEIEQKHITDERSIEDICGKWAEFYDLDQADYDSLLQRISNKTNGDEGSDYQMDEAFDNIPRGQYDAFTAEITDILKYKGLDDESIEEIFAHYPKLIKGGFDIGDTPHDVIKTVLALSHGYNNSMDDMNNARTDLNEILQENFDWLKLDTENLNPNSFGQGWRYEYAKQKTKDIDKAKETAEKNLVKNPLHYINLLADIKDKKKRTDLPVELDKKMSNTTDKLNATKIDTPNAKASAHKAKQDNQKVPKYKEDTFTSKRAKGIKGVMDLPGKEKIIRLSELQYIAKTIASVIKEQIKK